MQPARTSSGQAASHADLTALFQEYWGDRLTPEQVEALATAVQDAAGDRQARTAQLAHAAEATRKTREARRSPARWFGRLAPAAGQAAIL